MHLRERSDTAVRLLYLKRHLHTSLTTSVTKTNRQHVHTAFITGKGKQNETPSTWDPPSSVILRSGELWFCTEVSGKPVGHIFTGQKSEKGTLSIFSLHSSLMGISTTRMKSLNNNLGRKPEGKWPFGRPGGGWVDNNIKFGAHVRWRRTRQMNDYSFSGGECFCHSLFTCFTNVTQS
jgi:hypothetical protein